MPDRPQDVPDELHDAFLEAFAAAFRDDELVGDAMRAALAAVLPAHERQVMAKLFGTPEEIAAREAEAAQRTPDDTVRLCEMARPGEHERQVRERVAAELREDADAHRRVVARKPSEHDDARLARARTLDDAASRISGKRGES